MVLRIEIWSERFKRRQNDIHYWFSSLVLTAASATAYADTAFQSLQMSVRKQVDFNGKYVDVVLSPCFDSGRSR